MTHLDTLIPPHGLASALQARQVTRKRHPHMPLSIYTYAPVCQYENLWNDVTMRCRGLVVDDTSGEIIALPFPKIFVSTMHNHGHAFAPPLPAEPFEVFEKADGSLAIVFHYGGRWHAASKGSFISGQAAWAQSVLDRSDTSLLDPSLTYLAEAIYPSNRIVIDYGTREELVLLAAYRPADLGEVPLKVAGQHWAPIGPTARSWGLSDSVQVLEQLAAVNTTVDGDSVSGTTAEGYVIRFASGQRAKIKLADYLKIHALFTGTNERTVWEVLAAGQDPADLFDQVPDEFRDWAHKVAAKMRTQVADWIAGATAAYQEIGHLSDRKAFALRAVNSPYRSALFQLYDGRDITVLAWKHIKPRGDASPYASDDEG
ncbi:RNA ligase [Streptomyces europaeiscabiei]|uniref:RNA ligase n=1 Tax=Streptomyces europaeiscabiei TaxID=146819 RepID=UPI0029BCAB99|nr:RNA ligase [Streptomyces europaeiscabiei]MDX3695028.1 RNA ligase [Streptomyces europaeiscabiei]